MGLCLERGWCSNRSWKPRGRVRTNLLSQEFWGRMGVFTHRRLLANRAASANLCDNVFLNYCCKARNSSSRCSGVPDLPHPHDHKAFSAPKQPVLLDEPFLDATAAPISPALPSHPCDHARRATATVLPNRRLDAEKCSHLQRALRAPVSSLYLQFKALATLSFALQTHSPHAGPWCVPSCLQACLRAVFNHCFQSLN